MARSRSRAQIQRLALLNLRNLREDRHGGQSGTDFGAGSHCADFAVQPPFGHQQAWAPTAIDEPQPQARAGFPFARGDAVAAGGFACGRCGDGWPKPAARPAQRPRIIRANDDRGVRLGQRCSAQVLAAHGIGSEADRVQSRMPSHATVTWPRQADFRPVPAWRLAVPDLGRRSGSFRLERNLRDRD